MIQVGKKAPQFTLPGSDGKTHSLRQYLGRRVLLYFYPKDATPGCTQEACGFRDLSEPLHKHGVVVLGVSRDSLASHDRFIREFQLPFVLLTDADGAVMEAYAAWGEKLMYGKKVTGCIRSTVLIDAKGVVEKHWPKVRKAADHPAEVLAFMATSEASS